MISSLTGGASSLASIANRYDSASSSSSFASKFGATARSTSGADTVSISADAFRLNASGGADSAGLTAAAGSDDTYSELKDALTAFKKEASMTPAARARRDVMKSMNLTDKDIAKMPADQQSATEKAIADAVAKRLQLVGEKPSKETSALAA